MSVKIVCPSRKRAGKILTKIDDMIICVDEKELPEYKSNHPENEIITHPGLKKLSLIRQFIYEKFGDVFMVDDDIIKIHNLYSTKNNELSPEDAKKLIIKTYERCQDVGAFLFGFNNDPVITHYNQHKPFMFNGYINGSAIGLIKSKNLYFTEKTVAAESHWINLLNAYYNRYLFIDKRFCFAQKQDSTFMLEGGQVGKRTLETEKNDTLFLKKMFGDSVEIKKAKNKTKQLHEYQRELRIKL